MTNPNLPPATFATEIQPPQEVYVPTTEGHLALGSVALGNEVAISTASVEDPYARYHGEYTDTLGNPLNSSSKDRLFKDFQDQEAFDEPPVSSGLQYVDKAPGASAGAVETVGSGMNQKKQGVAYLKLNQVPKENQVFYSPDTVVRRPGVAEDKAA